MKVSAVVVSHRHSDELGCSLPALVQQVDEILVIANVTGSVGQVPDGVSVLENPRPLSLAANVNLGIAATSGDYVLNANPDAIAEPGAVAGLVAFADSHPRCGIAGPQMRWPDGSWQPSRRRFPTVRGTVVRRTPLRRVRPPYEAQREHYSLDDRPTEPAPADWMLGAFLLMRRSMLDEIGGWDGGSGTTVRTSISAIARCGPAGSAGTCPTRSSRTTTQRSSTGAFSRGTRSGMRAGWRASSASIRNDSSPYERERGSVRSAGRRLDRASVCRCNRLSRAPGGSDRDARTGLEPG